MLAIFAQFAALPTLDAVVLNAGGLGSEALTDHGVTQNFAMNVLGHAVLTEGLDLATRIRGAGGRAEKKRCRPLDPPKANQVR